ncbi:MAG: hypothetical protein ACTH2Q_00530 [Propionibacteriaceae bacterium]
MLAIVGVVLTATALGVAVAIYRRQDTEQREFRRHVDGRFDDMIRERIDADRDEPGSAPDEYMEPPRHVTRTVGEVSVVRPDDIPLAIVGDLGAAIQRGTSDNSGWVLGEVRAGYRRAGRGNHAWYLLLQDRSNHSNAWVVRIARGGQRKSVPTVTWENAVEPAGTGKDETR